MSEKDYIEIEITIQEIYLKTRAFRNFLKFMLIGFFIYSIIGLLEPSLISNTSVTILLYISWLLYILLNGAFELGYPEYEEIISLPLSECSNDAELLIYMINHYQFTTKFLIFVGGAFYVYQIIFPSGDINTTFITIQSCLNLIILWLFEKYINKFHFKENFFEKIKK
jgi:hypothetical protein